MNPAKRRRLESTQLTLNKPFRSPLRTTRTTLSDGSDMAASGANPHVTTAPALHHASPSKASNFSLASIPAKGHNQYALLTRKLHKLRQSLDIAEQALQIVTSGQNDQLEALTTKWKFIAHGAADELFIDTKARIDDMGGLETWTQKAQDDKLLWAEDERHKSHGSQSSILEPDEDDTSVEPNLSQSPKPIVHQAFTMQLMLRQMNVDPTAIGFDEESERWVN
ncbi:uncharacterized protein A1O9_07278 [Exophiala aquamarina CBS 119918]|uniref:Uncharacterized protein n=1 Tax=Exophiala aquamarina CBS 119918 TaxID=1182545 RepID=A0A072PCR8_9EURO|nr:uncharacterized protein A1O9_07278 [Exophiala aquamarina CBS 119918]KEF57088.1 hypothetical protein A1O9_07278 [Exophiala aquamarina CBS 119918]